MVSHLSMFWHRCAMLQRRLPMAVFGVAQVAAN
jgi:hypothetical protein